MHGCLRWRGLPGLPVRAVMDLCKATVYLTGTWVRLVRFCAAAGPVARPFCRMRTRRRRQRMHVSAPAAHRPQSEDIVQDDMELMAAIGRMVVNAAELQYAVAELADTAEGLRGEECRGGGAAPGIAAVVLVSCRVYAGWCAGVSPRGSSLSYQVLGRPSAVGCACPRGSPHCVSGILHVSAGTPRSWARAQHPGSSMSRMQGREHSPGRQEVRPSTSDGFARTAG